MNALIYTFFRKLQWNASNTTHGYISTEPALWCAKEPGKSKSFNVNMEMNSACNLHECVQERKTMTLSYFIRSGKDMKHTCIYYIHTVKYSPKIYVVNVLMQII